MIGREIKVQCMEQDSRLPNALVACMGCAGLGIGLSRVAVYGVKVGGDGRLLATGRNVAPLRRIAW